MDRRLRVLDLAETVDALVGDHTDDRTVPDDGTTDLNDLHRVIAFSSKRGSLAVSP
jgi:hypothetical protein